MSVTAYIGYTDLLEEGTFVWGDGGSSSYENWRTNEPNNYFGSELHNH